MAKSFTSALFIVTISFALGVPAVAANPCNFKPQKQQLDFQKHQLDFQKHQIDQQYPGPANAAYRESLKRQLEAQRRQLNFQKHQLDLQKRQCKAAYGLVRTSRTTSTTSPTKTTTAAKAGEPQVRFGSL